MCRFCRLLNIHGSKMHYCEYKNGILSAAVIFLLCFTTSDGFSSRIVGGYEAPKQFAPYHASLQNTLGSHVCGGAIVGADTIVTAAHCLNGAEPEHVKVVVGTSNLDIGGQQYDVKSIVIHDDYDLNSKIGDIALIKTSKQFEFNEHIQIIDIIDKDLEDNDEILLTGFGALEPNGESSRRMHVLELKVFNQDVCVYAMRYTREVHDTMFCTFSQIGEGTCHGDSGGPLVRQHKLAGLVSWGVPCAVGFPDVHTRILPYAHWIHENIHCT